MPRTRLTPLAALCALARAAAAPADPLPQPRLVRARLAFEDMILTQVFVVVR